MKRVAVMENVKGLTQVWAILKNNYPQYTIEGGKAKDKRDLRFTTLTFFHLQDDIHFVSPVMATYNSRDSTLTIIKTNGNQMRKYLK